MRTMFVAIAIACASAPAHADIEHAEVPGAADGDVLKGNVLVWLDAKLYLDPADTAPSIRLATLGKPRKDEIGQVVPMHVVGKATGAFVEVEPIKDVDCTWSKIASPFSSITRPKLFVKRADLAPTLFKRMEIKHGDGTRLVVEPGTPLGRAATADPHGAHVVSLLGDEIQIGPPSSLVVHAYKPRRVTAPPKLKTRKPTWLDAETATIGAQTIALRNPWTIPKPSRRGDVTLVTLRARCLTAVVAVPHDKVITEERLLGIGGAAPGTIIGTRGPGVVHYIPKKTPLTSETGAHVVALAATDVIVDKPAADAKLACIENLVDLERPVDMAPGINETRNELRTMKLCAPVAKVKTK